MSDKKLLERGSIVFQSIIRMKDLKSNSMMISYFIEKNTNLDNTSDPFFH